MYITGSIKFYRATIVYILYNAHLAPLSELFNIRSQLQQTETEYYLRNASAY